MDAGSAALVLGVFVLSGMSALALGERPVRLLRARRPQTLLRRAAAVAAALPVVREARRSELVARRRAACLGELPVLLDVVTLGLSAGLSFDASLELYCARYHNELSDAFSEAMLGWRIGARGREEALWDLAEELGVTALRRFASVVGESLAFGTPLAEALERQAQAIRDEQRSQVEEEIERVPVKMLVPLGTLIVPAMFLAILGPLMGSVLVVG